MSAWWTRSALAPPAVEAAAAVGEHVFALVGLGLAMRQHVVGGAEHMPTEDVLHRAGRRVRSMRWSNDLEDGMQSLPFRCRQLDAPHRRTSHASPEDDALEREPP